MMVMAGLNQEVKSAIIPTLFNSGVDSAGTTVATGSVDAHYSLISVPPGSGFTTSAYVADTTAPIVSAWVNPGSTARWIGPVTDVATMSAATTTGDYVYQTSFDLTGFDETSAVLTGQCSYWVYDYRCVCVCQLAQLLDQLRLCGWTEHPSVYSQQRHHRRRCEPQRPGGPDLRYR